MCHYKKSDDKAGEKEKGKNYEREQNALKKQMLV